MSKISLKSYVIFGLFTVFCTAGAVFGQDGSTHDNGDGDGRLEMVQIEEIAPPTFVLSKNEGEQLRAKVDAKDRTLLCLQLANSRLQRAEQLTDSSDFFSAMLELANYQAVVTNGIKFLKTSDSKKVRENMKRLELALRGHVPRIEAIRRSTPFEYAVHVKTILNFSRDTRSQALETFFSDTVVAEGIRPAPAVAGGSNTGFTPQKKP